ncbi:MAG: S-formylglutathione hydrolase [Myxococcales bacterium]|nr:S-formylglutathione hydrolase [Myxococcales bacterium]
MTLETLKTHASFGGTQGYYRHDSRECGGPMELSVFVPPGASAERRRPVVWYLSGLTCTAENFTAKAGAQRVAADLGLIVVAPDTSPRGAGYAGEDDDWDFGTGAGFYVDATTDPWRARYRMASYVTSELHALVHDAFPTRGPGHESLTGHSMGGHGALTLGLKHADRYRSLSAFSPIVAPSQVPWGEKAFRGYLGDDREAWQAHDATALVRAGARHPAPILIDQGLADPFLERELRPELFEAACAEADQPLELRRHEGYDHSYFFIATFIEDHLRFHARHLG